MQLNSGWTQALTLASGSGLVEISRSAGAPSNAMTFGSSSSLVAWVVAVLALIIGLATTALWLRARKALATVAQTFAAVDAASVAATRSSDPSADQSSQLTLTSQTFPETGPFASTGTELNKSLRRLRGAQTKAELHDVALATLEPERILEAAAQFGESIAETDGLDCASVTCVRFFDDRERLAQSYTRYTDGDRELVILNVPEPFQWQLDTTSIQRFDQASELPDFLSNLSRPLTDERLEHIDMIPLRCAPGSTTAGRSVLGVLALGGTGSEVPKTGPLRLDQIPGTLALTRSIAQALETCERKLNSERLANDSLLALARAADSTSSYTRGHSERVAQLAVRLGKELELLPSELERLRQAALLHDLGSVAISQRVLDQEEAYDEEHRALMRPHVELGLGMLEPLASFAHVLDVIGQHHEWWNGEGYPNGLAGEDIDPAARILTVVDVYEAMTSTRPYRRAFEPERALAHLHDKAGSQFEPRVVEALARLLA